MTYPDKNKRSTTVRIPSGLDEAIIKFLKTDKARLLGFRYKSDVIETAVRDFLIKYGFEIELGPRFEHFNVYDNHVTIWDKKLKCLVDVYFNELEPPYVMCTICEKTDCEHVKFALSLPKVLESLKNKGWIIEEKEEKIYISSVGGV